APPPAAGSGDGTPGTVSRWAGSRSHLPGKSTSPSPLTSDGISPANPLTRSNGQFQHDLLPGGLSEADAVARRELRAAGQQFAVVQGVVRGSRARLDVPLAIEAIEDELFVRGVLGGVAELRQHDPPEYDTCPDRLLDTVGRHQHDPMRGGSRWWWGWGRIHNHGGDNRRWCWSC